TGENKLRGSVLGQEFALEKKDGAWKLKLPRQEVALDTSETEALLKASQRNAAMFVTAGLNLKMLDIAPDSESIRGAEAERAKWISQLSSGGAVLLDSTTVQNAVLATEARTVVNPAMLLDLSVVAFAFVAFDNVVVSPNAG